VQIFIPAAIVMMAFAANSLLTRAALADGAIGPLNFTLIRVGSGAIVLLFILALRERRIPRPLQPDLQAVCSLVIYMFSFSLAYVSIESGIGALIFFGGAMISMILAEPLVGRSSDDTAAKGFTARQHWFGVGLSVAGLCILLWPSENIDIPFTTFALMTIAAVSWGIYSLTGRLSKRNIALGNCDAGSDRLSITAWNFAYALPAVLLVSLAFAGNETTSGEGIALAALCGAVTSGLGYVLWYYVLRLQTFQKHPTMAAHAQLSVPVIAMVFGFLLLGETITLQSAMAALLVMGGIALGTVYKTA